MGKNDFLENLKKAVDEGEFNSDAAKIINDIDKLADGKGNNVEELQEKINKRIDEGGKKESLEQSEIKSIDEMNEKFNDEIRENDIINTSIANLLEMEKLVNDSVLDLLSHVDELNENYFNGEDGVINSKYEKLYNEMSRIKDKLNIFINN